MGRRTRVDRLVDRSRRILLKPSTRQRTDTNELVSGRDALVYQYLIGYTAAWRLVDLAAFFLEPSKRQQRGICTDFLRAGRYPFRFSGLNRPQNFNDWGAFRFFSTLKDVTGFFHPMKPGVDG